MLCVSFDYIDSFVIKWKMEANSLCEGSIVLFMKKLLCFGLGYNNSVNIKVMLSWPINSTGIIPGQA